MDPDTKSQAIVTYHQGTVIWPTGRLVCIIQKSEQVPTDIEIQKNLQEQDQKLNANALDGQEDRPDDVNVQQEVKSVDQQAPVQKLKTDGGQADVILP